MTNRDESSNLTPIQAIGVFILVLLTIGVIVSVVRNRTSRQEYVAVAETVNQQITLGQFLNLRDGITYREAVKVLGKAGTEISRSSIGGHLTVMYQWQNNNFSNMNAMFQNDKLITKAQFGLK